MDTTASLEQRLREETDPWLLLNATRSVDLAERGEVLQRFLDLVARKDPAERDALLSTGREVWKYRMDTVRGTISDLVEARKRPPAPGSPEAIAAEEAREEARRKRQEEARANAAEVFNSPDPIDCIRQALRDAGYGGDLGLPLLVYLGMTTCLLDMRDGTMPCHMFLLGSTSVGKSYLLKKVQSLLPAEGWHVIDASSERVLLYDTARLDHRVLIFPEADSLPRKEDHPPASAVRSLCQDHCLRYQTVVRDEEGDFVVKSSARPGPTTLITTGVRRLEDQLDSRLFVLEVPEDAARVRMALATQARIELQGVPAPNPAIPEFWAYLKTLAPIDVVVPFADTLAAELGRRLPVARTQRDFAKLMSLVKATAVLRLEHRERDACGRLVATIDDYRLVFDLTAAMYETSTSGASDNIRRAVEAACQLYVRRGQPCTVTDLAQTIGAHRRSVQRWAEIAVDAGWLVNAEGRPRHPAKLIPGEPLPERTALPSAEVLARRPVRTPVVAAALAGANGHAEAAPATVAGQPE